MGLELNNFYTNGKYLDNNPGWGAEDSEFKSAELIKALIKYAGDWRSFLDVGCGAGQITFNVAKAFPEKEIVGSELSPPALSLAKQKTAPNLCFTSDNPFANQRRWDVAAALDVFEHVDDAEQFLREIRDLASIKIFHIPLEITVTTALRASAITSQRKGVRHIHFYNKELALEMIRDNGMEIVSAEYTMGALLVPKRRVTKWANIVRRLSFGVAPDLTVRTLGGYSLMVVAR